MSPSRIMNSPEFRNNGIVDSLTQSLAPALFLENLGRELSSAKREKRLISILSIQTRTTSSSTELQLIAVSRLITKVVRSGEFFSRISESGFWIFVRGDQVASAVLGGRIEDALNGPNDLNRLSDQAMVGPTWRVSIVESSLETDLDLWITEIDKAHFNFLPEPGAVK